MQQFGCYDIAMPCLVPLCVLCSTVVSVAVVHLHDAATAADLSA